MLLFCIHAKLIQDRDRETPAAYDVIVIVTEVGATVGAALQAAELRKHNANDTKCCGLG